MINGRVLKFKAILFFSIASYSNYASIGPINLKPSTFKKIVINKGLKVRIRVKKRLSKVHISGLDLKRDSFRYQGQKKIKINCDRISKILKNKKSLLMNKPLLLASLTSATGLVSLGNEKYHGKLMIVSSKERNNCDVINETDMEFYISSLLTKEMNKEWPLESLKAQAVAARTYAYHKMISRQVSKKIGYEAYYDLENSEKHQVVGDFFDGNKRTNEASNGTAGEILVGSGGQIIPIFFHAKCGGKTIRPRQVWDNSVKGYTSVNCPFCHTHGKKNWNKFLSVNSLRRFLLWLKKKSLVKNFKKGRIQKSKIRLTPDNINNTTVRMYIGGDLIKLEKSLFRRYFGRKIFSSNRFRLSRKGKGLSISGRGLGHGVGLCQLGALDMAQKGWNYKEILSYYFPKHKLKRIY